MTGATHSQLCNAVSEQGCAIALSSPMSTIGPIPISLVGASTYLLLIALVMVMAAGRGGKWAKPFVAWVVIGSVTVSAILAAVSWSHDSWCPLCVGLYGVNTTLLVLLRLEHGPGWIQWCFQGPQTLLKHRKPVTVAILMFAITVGLAQWAYTSTIRTNVGSLDQRIQTLLHKAHERGSVPMSLAHAPIVGPDDAEMTLVKFSDFQCPYCKRFWDSVETVRMDRPSLRVAFRHYPLSSQCNPFMATSFHDRACQAAYAAVCAQRQGKFWEMGSALFQNQPSFDELTLLRLANEVGLKPGPFRQCLKDPSVHEAVIRDVLEARTVGVEGTPGFLINGHRFDGSLPPAALGVLIDALNEPTDDNSTPHPMDPLWATLKQAASASPTEAPANGMLLAGSTKNSPSIHLRIGAFDDTARRTVRALLQLDQQTSGEFPIWIQTDEPSEFSGIVQCAFAVDLGARLLTQWSTSSNTNTSLLRTKLLAWAPKSEACLQSHTRNNVDGKGVQGPVELQIDGIRLKTPPSTADMERVLAMIALRRTEKVQE